LQLGIHCYAQCLEGASGGVLVLGITAAGAAPAALAGTRAAAADGPDGAHQLLRGGDGLGFSRLHNPA
jgi:hypothetical protein